MSCRIYFGTHGQVAIWQVNNLLIGTHNGYFARDVLIRPNGGQHNVFFSFTDI